MEEIRPSLESAPGLGGVRRGDRKMDDGKFRDGNSCLVHQLIFQDDLIPGSRPSFEEVQNLFHRFH